MASEWPLDAPEKTAPEEHVEALQPVGRTSEAFSGPLYEQVRERILSRIESGAWRAGAPIPPEVQLSRDFGVSVGTVRKALDQLARDRILVRERGRGTFIKDGVAARPGLNVRLGTDDGRPVEAAITLVATEYAVASAAEVDGLRMLKAATLVPRALRLRREWRRADRLLCLETITVDASRFPNLQFEVEHGAETFFQTYADKYHAPVDRTQWALKPLAEADPRGAPLREEHQHGVVMRSLRTAFDARDVPLEICEQLVLLDGELTIWSGR
jgi:GntR family transcriptional regulator